MESSTTTIKPTLSELVDTTQQPTNLVLIPTTSASSSPASASGEVSSSQPIAAKSSQKVSLKSQVAPEKILEGLEEQQQKKRVLQVKKSDLESFIQMMKEFEEIMKCKSY
jgi:hypothetical protein